MRICIEGPSVYLHLGLLYYVFASRSPLLWLCYRGAQYSPIQRVPEKMRLEMLCETEIEILDRHLLNMCLGLLHCVCV